MPLTGHSEKLRAEREAARLRGDIKFASSVPCKYGHVGDRYTSTKGCISCIKPPTLTRPGPIPEVEGLSVSFSMAVPISLKFTEDQRDALYHYLIRCVEQFHKDHGLTFPYNINWLREALHYGYRLADYEHYQRGGRKPKPFREQ